MEGIGLGDDWVRLTKLWSLSLRSRKQLAIASSMSVVI